MSNSVPKPTTRSDFVDARGPRFAAGSPVRLSNPLHHL